MENFNQYIGRSTYSVIEELFNEGYLLNYMTFDSKAQKSLFYARKNDLWIEFCTTITNGKYDIIHWAANYNEIISVCAENLESLKIKYISSMN